MLESKLKTNYDQHQRRRTIHLLLTFKVDLFFYETSWTSFISREKKSSYRLNLNCSMPNFQWVPINSY